MADQQTGNPKTAGRVKLSRGIFLVLCLVFAALFVTIWIKLASKDVEVEIVVPQSAIEHSSATGESKAADHGRWYISLASFRLKKDADALVKRCAQKGVKTDTVSFIGSRKGYQWHRVRVAGFTSEQEAQNALVVVSKKLGIGNAWVGEEL